MSEILRRKIPTSRQIKTRNAILKSYEDLEPVDSEFYGFEKGNKKTGETNSRGEIVLVWNLPPVVTCPGADSCLEFCYNADTRINVFPIESWCVNWFWALNKKDACIEKINNILKCYDNPVVRVHSSGDFFSIDYVKMWVEIANQNPHAKFWAYTRSWKVNDLAEAIQRLSQVSNFNLFASINKNEKSPSGMRWCFVGEDDRLEGYFNCPEQYINGPQCIECRECFTKKETNIYFSKH